MTSRAAAGALLLAAWPAAARSAPSAPLSVTQDPAPESPGCIPEAPPPSLLMPPRPRGLTRVVGTLRPFFNVLATGGGAIGDLTVEHYFVRPFKLGIELAPTAVAFQPRSKGAVTHLRLDGAFVSDYLELGVAIGGRLENFGPGGISLAGRLRLGAVDGLDFQLTYGYALIRNHYSGQPRVAFSNVLATVEVPLVPRLALVVDGGFSFDVWIYATVGLKHVLIGDGGRGSWILRAGFGLAWVLDQFPCQYQNPERCEGASWGLGPTIAAGVEHRF